MSKQLFEELLTLCSDPSSSFFVSKHEFKGSLYWIFSYRLSTFSEWLKSPNTLWSRGIMFEVDSSGNYVRLACRPMKKFFNLNENPFVMNLDLSETNIKNVLLKRDGSLISTFVHGSDELQLKTKQSLTSSQAHDANLLLSTKYNKDLRVCLDKITKQGITVDLEFTAPHNRVVVPYSENELTILSAQVTETGESISFEELSTLSTEIEPFLVERVHPSHYNKQTYSDLVSCYSELTNIEGFVVHLNDGTRFKVKTDWYNVQHKMKEKVDSARTLFESVMLETSDDLRSLFHDNEYILNRISIMEKYCLELLTSLQNTTETYYQTNKHLSRKDYAISGQKQLSNMEFGLAMSLYAGKPVNYKEFLVSQVKKLTLPITDNMELDTWEVK